MIWSAGHGAGEDLWVIHSSPPKPLFAMRTFLLITLLAVAIPADITSQTVIDAGKQFVLGGSQRGAFRVAAHNVGPVLVSVAERAPNGTLTERGRLEPGGRATLDFGRGAAALVRNLGERQAKLDFKISGDVSFGMGMGYEGLRK